jgi:hypothetical protein
MGAGMRVGGGGYLLKVLLRVLQKQSLVVSHG